MSNTKIEIAYLQGNHHYSPGSKLIEKLTTYIQELSRTCNMVTRLTRLQTNILILAEPANYVPKIINKYCVQLLADTPTAAPPTVSTGLSFWNIQTQLHINRSNYLGLVRLQEHTGTKVFHSKIIINLQERVYILLLKRNSNYKEAIKAFSLRF